MWRSFFSPNSAHIRIENPKDKTRFLKSRAQPYGKQAEYLSFSIDFYWYCALLAVYSEWISREVWAPYDVVATKRLMNTNSNTADEKDVQAMLGLRDLLSAWFGGELDVSSWSEQEWNAVIATAVKSKTIGFLKGACDKGKLTLPSHVEAQLKDVSVAITQKNQINFAWTLKATQVLEAADIDVLAFKGPLRTRAVYTNWSSRSSSDVDLLVRKTDYEAALQVLCAGGYRTMVSAQSQWWRDCLGELPLKRVDGAGPIVDLHHQVQQPGGPYPKDMEAIFSTSERQTASQTSYRTPNRDVSRLITAICYGKAVCDDEPWAHHAHELLVEHARMNEEEHADFRDVAEAQGLSRLYDEALSNSQRLYRVDKGLSLGGAEDLALIQSAVGVHTHRPFFRTRRLWRWIDGGVMARGTKLSAELWHVLRSDMIRLREQRQGKLDALQAP